MRLWNDKIDEVFTQKPVSDPMRQRAPVFVLKLGLF